jgi:16S rRNA (cytidine1402-2'-O)-methyltransferase
MFSFYIVATPIGNIKDITLRAIEILKEVDFIVCEDTRVSAKLLAAYLINNKKLLVYNDHSTDADRDKIVELLGKGLRGALISDAGTPMINDPGFKLINLIRSKNFKLCSIPGASCVTTAISLAYLPTHNFYYLGFLPPKTIAKANMLKKIALIEATIIILESKTRVLDTVETIYNTLGNRHIVIARELTKLHEEVIALDAVDLIAYLKNRELKGEIVLLISGADADTACTEEEVIKALKNYAIKMSMRDAIIFTAEQFNIPKKQVYKLANSIAE